MRSQEPLVPLWQGLSAAQSFAKSRPFRPEAAMPGWGRKGSYRDGVYGSNPAVFLRALLVAVLGPQLSAPVGGVLSPILQW